MLLGAMFGSPGTAPGLPIADLDQWMREDVDPQAKIAAAFLAAASGPAHARYDDAVAILSGVHLGPAAASAEFLERGLQRMTDEVSLHPPTAERLDAIEVGLATATSAAETTDAIWRLLFLVAAGIRSHEADRIAELRARRTVAITEPVADPIVDPANEVLFTSNVLLTVPDAATDIDALPYPSELRSAIEAATQEEQLNWFDHPIQLGVEPNANELLYGLRGLDAAVGQEAGGRRVTCLLSVSVTHAGLSRIARGYLEAELARDGGLEHIDVIIVTEDETKALVDEVIVPALAPSIGGAAAARSAVGIKAVFGVDGRYGRHYSFLKAVAAVWAVAVNPSVRATFKFDLDQVFPQNLLATETGRTMFGHLRTPLWGSRAVDSDGGDIELGMLAGALVIERDIETGLFTPDVDIPTRRPSFDEHVFFSTLPQAISTRAEMMERYDEPSIGGIGKALERIHVTGGTNGIRVDALRRYRSFTPTWVSRAED